LRIAEEVIVNKSQLVNAVTEATDSSRRTVEDVVDLLLDTIVTEVRSGRKVTVVGFGTFNPTARGSRVGRNPRTGAVVRIPASKGVRFATGSTFKSALNPKEGVSMAVKKAAARRTVRKAPARKTAARKSTAKKAVKKAPARKAPARKTAAKKTAAKRTAKRAPARKAAKRTTRKAAKRPARRR
jgi:DNA-binding protein HU-beta